MTDTAKVFWSGRSQAVRLPKEYRFDTDTVTIQREGDGVLLRPAPQSHDDEWAWLRELQEKFGPPDEDMIAAALEEPEPQMRPELDDM
jgi:antitoxin VapB